jgi:hypothetical protein
MADSVEGMAGGKEARFKAARVALERLMYRKSEPVANPLKQAHSTGVRAAFSDEAVDHCSCLSATKTNANHQSDKRQGRL